MTGADYACAAQSRAPVATWDRPWREVVDRLRVWGRPARRLDGMAPAELDAAKRAAPCWSPHTLSRPERTLSAVVDVSALVLDYDHEAEGPEAVAARLYPYEVYAHATWRSTIEAPRCRAVLPLEAPIPADVWRGVYAMILAGIGEGADPACSDPTRLHVLPIMGPGGDTRACHRRGRIMDLRPMADAARAAVRAQAEEAHMRRAAEILRRRRAPPDARPHLDLLTDPGARARWGSERAGKVTGESVKHVVCPRCGDRSVWWPLRPEKMTGAACVHRNSCGWYGRLEEL